MILPPAFKSRPFTLYWTGQLISIAGTQMQMWSLYWHLRLLTDQPMVISGIGLVRFLPVILFSLLAGAAADQFDRRKTTILTQLAQGLVALLLGLTTVLGTTTVWLLFGLVAVQSIANAFDIPARQALIPSLVPRQDLANAYSLTSIAAKVGGILGPAVSGLVIVYLGLQWSYWINAISYLAVIAALIAMGNIQTRGEQKPLELRRTLLDIREGIEFIRQSPIILSAMILDFSGTFFSSAKTLLPFVASDILQVGAIEYGWLSASQSAGTLLVGVYLSQKRFLSRQGILISVSVVAFGFATILFGISTSFWLTLLALALIGVFDGLSSIVRNTVRQVLTPDAMRGRMMSITQIFFKGGPQLGEMESGLVAQALGVPFAIVSGGVGCVLAAWLAVRNRAGLPRGRCAERGLALPQLRRLLRVLLLRRRLPRQGDRPRRALRGAGAAGRRRRDPRAGPRALRRQGARRAGPRALAERGDLDPVRAHPLGLRTLQGRGAATVGRQAPGQGRLDPVRRLARPAQRQPLVLLGLLHVRDQAGDHRQGARRAHRAEDLLHGDARLRQGLRQVRRAREERVRREVPAGDGLGELPGEVADEVEELLAGDDLLAVLGDDAGGDADAHEGRVTLRAEVVEVDREEERRRLLRDRERELGGRVQLDLRAAAEREQGQDRKNDELPHNDLRVS